MRQDGIRDRIELLRFVLVAGLVMLHYGPLPGSDLSPFRGWHPGANPVATFANAFVLFFFLSAVPLLSAISGWLFFKNFTPSASFYLGRLRARSRSILLPMALWNVLVLGGFLVAGLLVTDGRVLSIIAYDVTSLSLKDVINAVFGVTQHPVNFQFWFLRDLFLTILLAPVLGLALRHAPVAGAVFLGVVWLAGFDLWIFFRTDVLFFFYMGGLLQVRKVPVAYPAPKLGFALLAVFILLVAARTVGPAFIPESSGAGVLLFDYGSRLMRAVGVISLWLVAPVVTSTPVGQALARFGAVAFFLHAFHWPVNQFVKHGLATLLPPQGDGAMLANYAVTGLLTVLLAILAARVLGQLWPTLYDVLSGGRARANPTTARVVPAG